MEVIGNENIREFLDSKYAEYCKPRFIETDPICIPHAFSRKEDVEVAAFLVAAFAWGARPLIIKTARKLMERMDWAPGDFVRHAKDVDFVNLVGFKYRTFNDSDLLFFVHALQHIYVHEGGLEQVFTDGYRVDGSVKSAIAYFRAVFFSVEHLERSEKHVANVHKNSAAKRINMFLRWMVRSNQAGVDFGLWKLIPTSALMLPLDLHSGNVARKLGLLQRSQSDWKSVVELTQNLREYDSNDPAKYDFALFGLGVFEKMWM